MNETKKNYSSSLKSRYVHITSIPEVYKFVKIEEKNTKRNVNCYSKWINEWIKLNVSQK